MSLTPVEKRRPDDNEEVMKDRVALFERSIPIFKRYSNCGQLRRVGAQGGIDQIFSKVEKVFGEEGLV
jgi:adenylate kinase family enzyme